jgi:hypothetical protein
VSKEQNLAGTTGDRGESGAEALEDKATSLTDYGLH